MIVVLAEAKPDWPRLRPELFDAFGATIYMVTWTMIVGGILGLIVGVMLYTTREKGIFANKFLYWTLNGLVNFVRPIPFIILLAVLQKVTLQVVGTTTGPDAAIFVMTIAATFAIARIVEQNLMSIDPGTIEAARAMGASRLKIIRSVIVPEALGPLILGYTYIVIAVIDMSAMAGTVGGGGLGDFAIMEGYQRFLWPVTLVTTLIIIALVQCTQLLGNFLAKKVMRR